jgi:carbamoyltransferase
MITLGVYGSFDWRADKSFNEFGEPTWCHDAGATLFINGKHICSISEERLSRLKHDGNFPIRSIEYCMRSGNISLEDVDIVCIPSMCVAMFYKKWYEGTIEKMISTLCPNAEIRFVSHHLSHAAAAVFSSDFNEGSFLTLDGAGSLLFNENFSNTYLAETNSIGYFNKKKGIFRFFNGVPGANNFGGFYHSLSHHIYCEKVQRQIDGSDEKYRETWDGKIMGLSAYGCSLDFKEHHKLYKMSKDLCYDDVPYVSFSDNPSEAFKFTNADEKSYILQKNFELALLDYVTELKKNSYLEDNICLSGGSFLNVLGNSILKQSGLFEGIHVPPCPNDVGLHFGAACFAQFKNNQPIELPENIALLGREYSQEEIENSLKESEVSYEKYENFEELCEFTALQLNSNKIIGWFQNRSEFGPRALGSRSLLMHPGPAENKDLINERVKHREYWRPFAGIILEKNLTDYFNEDFNSPYMLYSLTVKDEKRNEIAAITHKDNTCRIQTVNAKLNPQVNTLIEKFKEISGIPVLLNTSFNDNGEPIVESPQDAVRSFKNMDIDYLVIGNFIVRKS